MNAQTALTHKQEVAVTTLLTCPTIVDAARRCGIAEVTLHRWLKQATFQAAYRAARGAVVRQAITQLQRATSAAVQALRRVMQDPGSPASATVSAAKSRAGDGPPGMGH
jgi:transposase-like protein